MSPGRIKVPITGKVRLKFVTRTVAGVIDVRIVRHSIAPPPLDRSLAMTFPTPHDAAADGRHSRFNSPHA